MRKLVKPAHPDASIPDPERGTDLPPEGRAVTWSAHWARMAARDDVEVSEIPAVAEAPKDPPKDPPPGEPEGEPAEHSEASEAEIDPAPAPHADA